MKSCRSLPIIARVGAALVLRSHTEVSVSAHRAHTHHTGHTRASFHTYTLAHTHTYTHIYTHIHGEDNAGSRGRGRIGSFSREGGTAGEDGGPRDAEVGYAVDCEDTAGSEANSRREGIHTAGLGSRFRPAALVKISGRKKGAQTPEDPPRVVESLRSFLWDTITSGESAKQVTSDGSDQGRLLVLLLLVVVVVAVSII